VAISFQRYSEEFHYYSDNPSFFQIFSLWQSDRLSVNYSFHSLKCSHQRYWGYHVNFRCLLHHFGGYGLGCKPFQGSAGQGTAKARSSGICKKEYHPLSEPASQGQAFLQAPRGNCAPVFRATLPQSNESS
jgi:hypothetical protein